MVFINKGRKYQLKGHTGLIRAADKNPVKEEFATAGRDKTIKIWKLEGKDQTPIKSFTANSRINAMRYTADGKRIIAAGNDGSITIWDLETGENMLLEKKEGVRALSIGQSKKRDIMAVGFENGSVILFYPDKNLEKQNYLLSKAGIKSIDISSSDDLLSVSKENKKVDINKLNAINVNTIRIMDHDVKVTNLAFANDDRLYGLCEDNTIRYWEKNNKLYADAVKSMISRNFTKEEWKNYVGENVKYEKTVNK